MRYSAEEIFKDFVKEFLPQEYSHLPMETLKDICYTPFLFLRRVFQSDILTEVRFKYFGVFFVSARKTRGMMNRAEIRHAKGYITDEEFQATKFKVQTYFNSIKEEEDED